MLAVVVLAVGYVEIKASLATAEVSAVAGTKAKADQKNFQRKITYTSLC